MAGKTKAPKEPKPKKEKAPKAEKPKKEPKLPKSAKKVERLIQEANANGSIDALDSAKRITKRYDAYLAAVGKVKEVTTECGLRLKAENAKFETVVTAPIPQGPKDEQEAFCVEQLSKIHVGWQDLSEVKGQIQVDRKEVKEKKSLALKSFERAIQEHKQLVLPMTGADD